VQAHRPPAALEPGRSDHAFGTRGFLVSAEWRSEQHGRLTRLASKAGSGRICSPRHGARWVHGVASVLLMNALFQTPCAARVRAPRDRFVSRKEMLIRMSLSWPGAARLAAAASVFAACAPTASAVAIGSRSSPDASHRSAAAANTATTRYTDPLGWRLSYPDSWHRQRISVVPSESGESAQETIVANFRLPPGRRIINGKVKSPVDVAGRFPSNGMAFVILHPGVPWPSVPTTPFPLRLDEFRPDRSFAVPTHLCAAQCPRELTHSFARGHTRWNAFAFLGATSTMRSRTTLGRIVRSLRFAVAGR
jgi:hypothetical protein